MSVRDLTGPDSALVDRLVEEYAFKPYRNYRLLPRQRQAAVIRAEIDRAQRGPDRFGIVAGKGESVAVVVCRALPWDTAFFGVPMGRIDYLLRSSGATALQDGLAAAVDRLNVSGIKHITLRLDVADSDAIAIAQEQGFRLVDALVTYVAHPKRPAPRALKPMGHIRPFVAEDTDQILEITRDAYRGFAGRFQLDAHLPKDRSDEFYMEWARKCLVGDMADRVLVAEAEPGRLYGWASVRRAEPVSSIGGAPISSGSLGACRLNAPGAYAGLISALATENHAAGVLTEAPTQNSNFEMIRVLESVGAQYARTDYTFHKWLG